MAVPSVSCRLLLVALWMGLGGWPSLMAAYAGPQKRAEALIQTRGTPLRAGVMRGGSQVALERAEGGDTPVLSFRSPRGKVVRLLLDTGAAASLVTPELVQRLGLPRHALAAEAFSLAGGGTACPTTPLSSTELPVLVLPADPAGPGLRLEGLEVLVLPAVALPPGVDGVLGAPTLRQLPVVVDPRSAIVALGDPALRWRQSMTSPPQGVPLTWRRGVPLLPLRVRPATGGPPLTLNALADTGAEGVFVTAALAERLTPLHPSQPARLVGVCGLQEVRRQRLFGLTVGSERLPNESVDAIILTNPVFALLDVDAIVGQGLLRGRRQLWRLDANPPRLELW
jgi:hypothetical protein